MISPIPLLAPEKGMKTKISSRAAYYKQWRANNPEKHRRQQMSLKQGYSNLRYTARRRKLDFSISLEYFKELRSRGCFYCGGSLPPLGHGVDRINSKFGYVIGNVRPCCSRCNEAKNDVSEEEFSQWICAAYSHWASKQVFESSQDLPRLTVVQQPEHLEHPDWAN
jgi:hypothetical protein